MAEVTSKLKIKLPKGNDTFNRQAYTDNLEAMEENAASQEQVNEPFYLKRVIYDNRDNRLELTFGKGRARFLDSLVSKTDESIYKINGPAANTVYFIYLQEDGSYIHNTNGKEMSGAVLIWKVITGTTVDEVEWEDLRGQLLGAAARKVQDNLDYHSNSSAPHTGHETKQGAQSKANTAETNAKKYADSIKPTKVSQLSNDKAYITKSGAPVQSVNGKKGSVTLTAVDVGAETPAGAQEKANKVEANAKEYAESHAKSYTDKEVAKANKKIDTHVVDYNKFKDEMTKPEYSYTEKTAQSLIDLPNATNGQISGVNIEGRTVVNLVGNGDLGTGNTLGGIVDTSTSVFSNSSIKAGYTWNVYFDVTKLPLNKYYFISVYGKTEGSSKPRICGMGIDTLGYSSDVWHRFGAKTHYTESVIKLFLLLANRDGDSNAWFDGLMLVEITEDEYKNLTVDELLQRYPFHNYTKSTFSNRQLKLTSKGKNLIPNYNDTLFNQGEGSTSYDNKWVNNKLEVRNGSYWVNGRGIRIKVIPNKNYKFTFSCIESSAGQCRIFISDPSGVQLKDVIKSTGRYTIEFKSISNSIDITFIHTNSSDKDNPVYFYDMIFSNNITDYTPYQFDTKYIQLPEGVDGLHSLPNGTKDEISMFDVRDGKVEFLDKAELRKNTKEIVLDGSENWTNFSSSISGMYTVQINGWLKDNNARVLNEGEVFLNIGYNDQHIFDARRYMNKPEFIWSLAFHNSFNLYLGLPLNVIDENYSSDLDGAKKYLSEHPITLTYQLAQPKVYELDMPALRCYENGSVEISHWDKYILKAEDIVELNDRKNYTRIQTRVFSDLKNPSSSENIDGFVKINNWQEKTYTEVETGKFNGFGFYDVKQKLLFALPKDITTLEQAKQELAGTVIEYQTDNPVLPAIQFAYSKNINSEIQSMNRAIKQNADILDKYGLMIGNLEDSSIIEMGENVNGIYVRWANGLQMCWSRFERDLSSTNSFDISMPVTFTKIISGGYTSYRISPSNYSLTTRKVLASSIVRLYNSSWQILPYEKIDGKLVYSVGVWAIGRWK